MLVLAWQVPGLCFTAKVLRRDPSHTGAVVIRFPEDGSSFWLPATEVPPPPPPPPRTPMFPGCCCAGSAVWTGWWFRS